MKAVLLVLCVVIGAAVCAPAPKPDAVVAAPVLPLSYSYNAYNSFITHPSGVYASPYAYAYPYAYGYNYPYVVV